MGRYRKKPVEVEAVQFTGENWAEMHEFTGHRNVENDLNPYMVDIFTEIGTYLATYLMTERKLSSGSRPISPFFLSRSESGSSRTGSG